MGFDREKRLEADPRDHALDDDLVRQLLDELHRERDRAPGKRTQLEDEVRAEDAAQAIGRRTLTDGATGESSALHALTSSLWPQHTAFDTLRARGLREVLAALNRVRSGRGLMEATLSAAKRDARPSSIAAVAGRSAPPDPAGRAMWRAAERRAATLYRDAVDGGEIQPEDPAVGEALARIGGGQPLPAALRKKMELELDVSLDRVRVHTDAVAADAARAVRAKAFTVGEDIFFAERAYAPESAAGQKLLAHELTHVVQAYQGRTETGSGVKVSSPGESLEREADAVATRIDRAPRARARAKTPRSAPAISPAASRARVMRKADPVSAKPSKDAPKQPAVQPKMKISRDLAKEHQQHRANRAKDTIKSTMGELTDRVGGASKSSLGHLKNGIKAVKGHAVGHKAKHAGKDHLHQAKQGEKQFKQHAKKALAKKHDKPHQTEGHAQHKGDAAHGKGIQFKEIGDYKKYMPEPMKDTDEREQARIQKLVKKKIEHDRAESRKALGKLKQAQQKQAGAIRAMKPALQGQIAGAQSKALGTVSASESAQCGAVQSHVAGVQAAVTASAATSKAAVTSAHSTTVAQIKAAMDAANDKLTQAKTKAISDIDASEAAQHQVITQLFQQTKDAIIQLGSQKAGEASGLGDSISLPYDGDKLEAAQKAAKEVAASYAEAMPGEAQKAADQIGGAEPQAHTDTTKIATDQKQVINDSFDQAKQVLDQIEQQAIEAADTAKDQAVAQIEQCASSTSSALSAHGASQVSAIRQQGAQARAGIIKQGQAAQAGVANACSQAASGIEKGAEGIIKGAMQIEAPDPQQTQAVVKEGIQQLQTGTHQVTAGLKSQAQKSSASLATAASGAASGMVSTAQAANQAADQIGAGGKQQIGQIAQGATQGLKAIGDNAKKTADQIAKDGAKGFEEVAKATDKAYQTSETQLSTALADQVRQVGDSFNQAVPTKETEDILANAKKAADAVKPWWQKALAFVVSIVVAVVVVVVITALIVTTGPVGAILVGAAAGALGSVAGQMASNLVLGNGLTEGITWQSVAMGAIGGGVAAGLTAGVGALAGNLAAGTGRVAIGATAVKTALTGGQGLTSFAIRTGVGVGGDLVSDAAAQLIVTGKYEFSTQNLITSLATNAVTSTSKFNAFQESAGGKVRTALGLPPVNVHVDAPSPGGGDGGGGGTHASGGDNGPAPHPTGGDHGPTGGTPTGDRPTGQPKPNGGGDPTPTGKGPTGEPHPNGGADPINTKGNTDPVPNKGGGDPHPTGDKGGGDPNPQPKGDKGGGEPNPKGGKGDQPEGAGTVERDPSVHGDKDGGGKDPHADNKKPGGDKDGPKGDHDPANDNKPKGDKGDDAPKGDKGDDAAPTGDHGKGDHDGPQPKGDHDDGGAAKGGDDEATTARDGELDDLGYPEGTTEKKNQAKDEIEADGKPNKDSVRDTKANEDGIKELEALLKDPKLTPEERAKIQKEIADKVAAKDDPTGNLKKDVEDAKAKVEQENGKDPNAKDPNAKDPNDPNAPKDGNKDPNAKDPNAKDPNEPKRPEEGLRDAAQTTEFAEKMAKLQQEWPNLSPGERLAKLAEAINGHARDVGMEELKVVSRDDIGTRNGQFDMDTWAVAINKDLLSASSMDPHAMGQLADTVYHEARHGQQWYDMARLLASQGMDAPTIATKLGIDPQAAAKAAGDKPLTPKQQAEAQSYYDSVYGKNRAHRETTLGNLDSTARANEQAAQDYKAIENDPNVSAAEKAAKLKAWQDAYAAWDKTYKDYRALPEEVDAWAAGTEARSAFDNVPPKSTQDPSQTAPKDPAKADPKNGGDQGPAKSPSHDENQPIPPQDAIPSKDPNPDADPGGRRTKIDPHDKDPENIRALTRENETADALAKHGYDVEQNPATPGDKNPDYKIEGHIFDNYAPSTGNARSIWDTVRGKVEAGQADRIVLNLTDSKVDMAKLQKQFHDWPIEGLKQIIIVRGNHVEPFTLPAKPTKVDGPTPPPAIDENVERPPGDPDRDAASPNPAAEKPFTADETYVQHVAEFKGVHLDEVTNFYEQMMALGVTHNQLIDAAVTRYPKLTRAEADAIFGYTTKLFYRDLNNVLNAGGSAEAARLSQLLQSGLESMPAAANVQYRGLRLNSEADIAAFDAEYAVGQIVETKAYWSTGPDPGNAYGGARSLVIHTTAAKDISELAFGVHFHDLVNKPTYDTEAIIPPGVRFEVVSVDKATGTVTLRQL